MRQRSTLQTLLRLLPLLLPLVSALSSNNPTAPGITISQPDGRILHPLTNHQHLQYLHCGGTPRLTITQEQMFILQSQMQFKATMHTETNSIKISGFAESSIATTADATGMNRYTGVMLVHRTCNTYFSMQKFNLTLLLSTPSPMPDPSAQSQYTHSSLTIPAVTYCLDQPQLLSISHWLNVLYIVGWSIIASFLPVYPRLPVPRSLVLCILVFLYVVSTKPDNFIIIIMLSLSMLLSIEQHRNNQVQQQIQQKVLEERQLTKASGLSLLGCFLMMVVVKELYAPEVPVQGQIPWVYMLAVYLGNGIAMLIVVQVVGCAVRLPYYRAVALYTIAIAVFAQYIPLSGQEYLPLQLPNFFVQQCRTYELLPALLYAPAYGHINSVMGSRRHGMVVLVGLGLGLGWAVGVWVLGWVLWAEWRVWNWQRRVQARGEAREEAREEVRGEVRGEARGDGSLEVL